MLATQYPACRNASKGKFLNDKSIVFSYSHECDTCSAVLILLYLCNIIYCLQFSLCDTKYKKQDLINTKSVYCSIVFIEEEFKIFDLTIIPENFQSLVKFMNSHLFCELWKFESRPIHVLKAVTKSNFVD